MEIQCPLRKEKQPRVIINKMISPVVTVTVGDLVKRTVKPYDSWLGIVVRVDPAKKKLHSNKPPQYFTTVWVKWTIPNQLLSNFKPEAYRVEDLQVVSKAIPPSDK